MKSEDVIDILVQRGRHQKAVERFSRRLLKGQGREPRSLVTDKLRSYFATHLAIMPTVEHSNHVYANNRAEVSHQLTRQREFTRVKVAIHAESRVGGNVVIYGELENVSFNGLLLRSETVLPEQTPCLVFVHLDGGQGGPTIEVQGLVTRTEPRKLAVQFMKLVGQESTQHLRNLVLYNSGTRANQVEEEFRSHVGLHAKS